MQLSELAPQRLARRQHRLRNPLQHDVPAHQLADACRQLPAAHVANLQSESAQQPAKCLLQIHGLDLHLLACGEKRPNLLRRDRLAVHRPISTHAQQLRDPACVTAVGLDRHGRQRRLNMARFKQYRFETRCLERVIQLLRQGTCLQADADDVNLETAQEGDQCLRFA